MVAAKAGGEEGRIIVSSVDNLEINPLPEDKAKAAGRTFSKALSPA